MSAFYAHVRGLTDEVPEGYSAQGLAVYGHLVRLGVEQQIEAHHPQLREQMGEGPFGELLTAFIRQSRWDSHFYGDLIDDFHRFLDEQAAAG